MLLPQVSDKARFNDSFNSLDFRLDRTFSFGDRYSLNLLGEAFNIFNVTNILGVSSLNYSGFANTLSPGPEQSELLIEFRNAGVNGRWCVWVGRRAGVSGGGEVQVLS